MEKAKETRAPPPAARPQQNVDLGNSTMQEKALPALPPQRGDLAQSKAARMNSAAQRTQEDSSRSVHSNLHSTAKLPPKRPLQESDDHHSRPGTAHQRFQQEHQSKRRRTSDNFEDDDDEDMTEDHPKMTAPPIRQSSSRQKVSVVRSGFWNAILIYYRMSPPNRYSLVVMQMLLLLAAYRDRHSLPSTT